MSEKWLRIGPTLQELVAERKDERKPDRGKIALIIPTFQDNSLLIAQIEALKSQSFKGFDIIVIYGMNDRFIQKPDWASMLHIRQRSRQGSAGSYYTGQKIAIEEGYESIVLSDNDCMPESDSLIEDMVLMMDGGAQVVMPNQILGTQRKGHILNMPHYYGCMSREALIKSGLTYLPLFYGGDDIDLIERIRHHGFTIDHVDSSASHPRIKPAILVNPWKRFYCTRGEIKSLLMRSKHLNAFLLIYIFTMMGLCYHAFGRRTTGNAFLKGVWEGTGPGFFIDSTMESDEWKATPELAKPPEDLDFTIDGRMKFDLIGGEQGPESWLLISDPRSLKFSLKRIANTMFRFVSARGIFGKRILFVEQNKAIDLPLLLMAKEAWMRFDGREYVLFRGRTRGQILFWMLTVAIASPVAVISSAALLFRGSMNRFLSGAESDGYGSEKNEKQKSEGTGIRVRYG